MSLKKKSAVTSSLGVVLLILLAITINLHSPRILTTPFYELFSTSFAHTNFAYNGTLMNGFQFLYLIQQTSSSCAKLYSAGGFSCKRQGQMIKYICLDDRFVPQVNNCTILSFGVDDDLRFEDDMMTAFDCRNYIFDPSVPHDDGQEEDIFTNGEKYYPVGSVRRDGEVNATALRGILERLSLANDVLKILLELGLIDVTQQLTFSSHLSFLKKLEVEAWRNKLQELMDLLMGIEAKGLTKLLYQETRSALSSILFPGDDIPRPSCGRLLYVRH